MLFSILVANYNNGHFFNDCYQSIIQQIYQNFEVIIVDDASTDNSVEIIQDIIKKDNRFLLYKNEENKGCGYTKHRCAALATGKILGFLDPDDALTTDALTLMVEKHQEFKETAIITSRYELVDLGMNFYKDGLLGSEIPKIKSYLTYGKGALTAFATFKKERYEKSQGINPTMKRAVDQDLYYKMEEQGGHVFLNKVLYRYRIHKNSISNNENVFKAEYWHFYTIINAYNRRKKQNIKIDNFSKKYIKEYTSDYFLSRFEKLKHKKKRRAQYYFIFKAIIVHPIHRFEFKIKSLILLMLGRI